MKLFNHLLTAVTAVVVYHGVLTLPKYSLKGEQEKVVYKGNVPVRETMVMGEIRHTEFGRAEFEFGETSNDTFLLKYNRDSFTFDYKLIKSMEIDGVLTFLPPFKGAVEYATLNTKDSVLTIKEAHKSFDFLVQFDLKR